LARRTPPDPETYKRLEAALHEMEKVCCEIAAERGIYVLIEHNRADSGRGGKYPYFTVRGLGEIELDAFVDDELDTAA
jgi:hypothetical protein